jgi:putative signal transducing protein
MFCPRCHAEYRAGFTECADCGVALVSQLRAAPKPTPNADLDFVEVLQCADPAAMALARGALDDAGILYLLNNEIPASVMGDRPYAWPTLPCTIKVARKNEKSARALLSPLESK